MNMTSIKILFFIVLSCLCSLSLFAQSSQFNELAWADEFNTDGAPNPNYWGYDTGTGQDGWGNKELQSYTSDPKNIKISNGKLNIEAVKDAAGWTSARIKTQGKFNFKYGRIEFRAKLPKGSGTWPALWMLGESITQKGWPACGEIDVMEHVGKAEGNVHFTLHTPSSSGNSVNTKITVVPTATEAFHIYAAEWTAQSITCFIDGQLVYTYNPSLKNDATWPFDANFFIIINMAIGGNFGSDPKFETGGLKNGVDPAVTSALLEVDYVRVYKPFATLQIDGAKFVKPNTKNVKFKANQVSGASYQWTVPEGATIVNGQGTSEITVNWGSREGKVSLDFKVNGQDSRQELTVKHIVAPTGSNTIIEDFSSPVDGRIRKEGGNFMFATTNQALRIDYDIQEPNLIPQAILILERPVDVTAYPVLSTRIKTFNKSGSVVARIDLEDQNQKRTTGNNVFFIAPVVADGEYFTYFFDFKNFWGAGNGQIDPSAVTTVRILLNYGVFGKVAKDSVWIDDLVVYPGLPGNFIQRPSNLTATISAGKIECSWTDQTTNETGFKLYKSEAEQGPFTEVALSLAANTATYTDPNYQEGKTFYYKVKAFNATGESEFSNVASSTARVTGVEDNVFSQGLVIYPNPVQSQFLIQTGQANRIQSVELIQPAGQTFHLPFQVLSNEAAVVSLSDYPLRGGLYLIRIQTTSNQSFKKIVIQ
jgi:beta-glucanase (GH16 family)